MSIVLRILPSSAIGSSATSYDVLGKESGMEFYRPTRGVVRLEQMRHDPNGLQRDLDRIQATLPWSPLGYGDRWGKIELWKNSFRHPILDSCPAIQQVIGRFDSTVIDVCLASLGPGGWVKEHRDISGGVPMGVARFHIPIVSHPGVEFYVSGHKLYLAPGEVWSLDTSYLHKLRNTSDVWRIHLIIDVALNDSIRALLPRTDALDALHRAYFWLICCTKAAQLACHPVALWHRITSVFRLRLLKKSSL